MKVALIALVLMVTAIILAYQFGGIGSLDPVQQGEKLKAEVIPGMDWTKVADERPPRKYRVIALGDDGFLVDGGEMKFDRATFDKDFAAGEYKLGFTFFYIFGAESQFKVAFNGEGKVVEVEKLLTMSDLLAPR